MQTLPLTEVVIPPSRQRSSTDKEKFSELKSSIKREGLFHAIILTEGNELVAGATRKAAVTELAKEGVVIFYDGKEVPLGHIPYTFTHKTDEASLFRIELEENLRREQLSPLDEAQALARLHELQQASAPEIVPGLGLKAPVTIADTAKILGEITGAPKTNDAQRISDSILVDKFKDSPEVKRAKTLSEAAKAARKVAERQFRTVLGGMEHAQAQGKHLVLQGDCGLILPTLPEGKVDVIIADPPYGIGADSFGEQSLIGHTYKDDKAAWEKVIEALESQASRICKPDAAMFMFCDIEAFFLQKNLWADLMPDWYIWPTPLIWHKPNRGHAPQPKRGPSRRYEAILYAIRGSREVRKVGSDVLSYNVPDDRLHGAGKPVGLYSELLSWVVYPGDVVLDPCAGSGVVIPAAHGLDCSAIAVEQDAGSAQLCREEVEKIGREGV